MDAAVEQALAIDRSSGKAERTVDITTTGRRSGEPRRIETWFYRVDGAIYLSGAPGRRGWAANLVAEPAFTFHLKNGIEADLPAHATQIVDEDERRRIFTTMVDEVRSVTTLRSGLEDWVAGSPLFVVEFD